MILYLFIVFIDKLYKYLFTYGKIVTRVSLPLACCGRSPFGQ